MRQLLAGTVQSQVQSIIEQTARETEAATKQDFLLAVQNKPINKISLVK